MKMVSFLSRFALICNILFLVCLVMQRTHDFIGSKDANGLIIILGWFVSPLLNLTVIFLYTARLLSRKPLGIRVWLVMTNFIFLVLQVFIHFILPS